MQQSALKLWLCLLFTMAFSAVGSFLFICGTVLVATKSWSVGVGSGMVFAAMSMMVLYRRSPLTRSLMVVLPASEATKEIESDFQVVETGKK